MNEQEYADFKALIDGERTVNGLIMCYNALDSVTYVRMRTMTPIAARGSASMTIDANIRSSALNSFLRRRNIDFRYEEDGFFRRPLRGFNLSAVPSFPAPQQRTRASSVFKANKTKLDNEQSPIRQETERQGVMQEYDVWTMRQPSIDYSTLREYYDGFARDIDASTRP